MNCIREAENYLRYYRDLKKSIEHADVMIARLTWQTVPKGAGVAQMEATGIHAGRPINTLNQFYQLQKWQEMRDNTLVEVERIDKEIDSICEDPGCERYKDILVMWYVEKLSKEDIAEAIGYSRRQSVYQLRKRAIEKFAVSLFGIEALQAIQK
ncbi:hypothetical protein Ga0466249_003394 [Sporomusaceae bacterium BoRhaA]|uniref:hypothetical protein n=1 Tax=Pelorhabdus rhamnosifermentans TaxID=2772457 RepID=UPI001C0630D6|nr:hypothetical protein [Pelorhabdus rhamnosifermentans]MBU2702267.1 hypothetical protein [Pelorhabdus rhamnosifermentans]